MDSSPQLPYHGPTTGPQSRSLDCQGFRVISMEALAPDLTQRFRHRQRHLQDAWRLHEFLVKLWRKRQIRVARYTHS